MMGLWRNQSLTFAAPMAPAHHQLIVLTRILLGLRCLLESSEIFGWYSIIVHVICFKRSYLEFW